MPHMPPGADRRHALIQPCSCGVPAVAPAALLRPALTAARVAIGVAAAPVCSWPTPAQVIDARVEVDVETAAALGNPPPASRWGRMLMTGNNFIDNVPCRDIWPGLSIFLRALSFNMLGDGRRDAVDPRQFRITPTTTLETP